MITWVQKFYEDGTPTNDGMNGGNGHPCRGLFDAGDVERLFANHLGPVEHVVTEEVARAWQCEGPPYSPYVGYWRVVIPR